MATSSILAPFILSWEGGYTNDPNDLGGATNKGVTYTTYAAYRNKKGKNAPTTAQLRALTDAEWRDIFKTMYWDRWRADEIEDQSIANLLVDWVWASGSYGIRIPQATLRVDVDGIVGPKTLAALNQQPPSVFFERLKQERKDFIERICKSRPTNKKYKKGWLRRIEAIGYGRLTCATGKKITF